MNRSHGPSSCARLVRLLTLATVVFASEALQDKPLRALAQPPAKPTCVICVSWRQRNDTRLPELATPQRSRSAA